MPSNCGTSCRGSLFVWAVLHLLLRLNQLSRFCPFAFKSCTVSEFFNVKILPVSFSLKHLNSFPSQPLSNLVSKFVFTMCGWLHSYSLLNRARLASQSAVYSVTPFTFGLKFTSSLSTFCFLVSLSFFKMYTDHV